jgi:RHS repeat-associated protein
MTYNVLGQKTAMSDPDMGYWTYQYDALGNLTYQTDAKGCTTQLAYDVLNRLTAKWYQSGCPTTTQPAYYYDEGTNGKGQLTRVSKNNEEILWVYDNRGRVISTTHKLIESSTARFFATQYAYNSSDQLTSMTYPGGPNGQAGEVVNYTYNAAGAIQSVIGASTYLQNAAYDAVGRPLTFTYNSALQQAHAYYPWTQNGGRLQALTAGSSANPTLLQDLSYSYDGVGNILSVANAKAGEAQTFTYDALDRLQSSQLSFELDPIAYTYDPTGNLLSAGNTTYTYNDLAHKHAVKTLSNGASYTYDANGNATQRVSGGQTFNLAYDAENRLVSVSGAASASYRYAGDGTRIVSIQGGVTTLYVGNYYEWTSTSSKKYYYAGAQRLAMRENNTLYYLVGDHLGSTSVVANSSGAFYSELRYTAWGETRYSSGTMPTDFRFTGQRQTQGAGLEWLYYYNARWYDPTVGRFLQADTLVPDAGNPQGFNRYAYTLNNPVRYTDASGHCIDGLTTVVCLVALTGVAAFAGGAAIYQYNVSGHSWWESGYYAQETLKAGGNAMVAALTVDVVILTAGSILCADGDCGNEAAAAANNVNNAVQQTCGGGCEDEAQTAQKIVQHSAGTMSSVIDKLNRYLLEPTHPKGGSKAEWFRRALGFTKDNLDQLAKQIIFDPSQATPTEMSQFGQKYEQIIRVAGANGKQIDVLFVWILNNDGVVRLVTSYPGDK